MKYRIIFYLVALFIIGGGLFMCTTMIKDATDDLTPVDRATVYDFERVVSSDKQYVDVTQNKPFKLSQVNVKLEKSIHRADKNTYFNTYTTFFVSDSIVMRIDHYNGVVDNRKITYDTISNINNDIVITNLDSIKKFREVINNIRDNNKLPNISNINLGKTGYILYNEGSLYIINPITLKIDSIK